MISYWRVLGQCCADREYFEKIQRLVTETYPNNDVAIENIFNFLSRSHRISLFEVWEVIRFLSPDPKGADRISLVDDAVRTIHKLVGGLLQSAEAQEILGLCCVDRAFTKALAKQTEAGKLTDFLKNASYVLQGNELEILTKFAQNPAFVVTFAAISLSIWDEPCDQSRVFNIKFNERHPWGSPGAWLSWEETKDVRKPLE